MRCQGIKPIKAGRKALKRFPGQAKNQIGMHMRLALADQPAQVFSRFEVVLLARNTLLHLGVEALNTDFKLQRSSGELHDQFFQTIRQAVGYDFEMHEQIGHRASILRSRLQAVQKELQDTHRMLDLQIKRAVNKLKVAGAALVQSIHLAHEGVEVKSPGRLIECTQAKLTLKGTTARCFHIQQSLGDISVGVLVIR